MSKCLSLVDLLGKPGTEGGLLKDKDMQVFNKIQQRICHELKESMQQAIDSYNSELETTSNDSEQKGGAAVKKIAHMFKLINM